MASNRVTPSPDGERYPLERMDMNTPERQQLYDPEEYERQQQGRQRERDLQLLQHKKKDIVIGDDAEDDDSLKEDILILNQTQEEKSPELDRGHDSGFQGDRDHKEVESKDLKQGHGSGSPLDDFNQVDGREIYTPMLPKAEEMDETKYSPPPKDPEEISPRRRLPPVTKAPSKQGLFSDNTEEDKHGGKLSTTALPPISGTGNRVTPWSEEMMQKSKVHQRSPGSHGAAGGQKTTPGLWTGKRESKNDIVYGAEENTEGAGCCGWLLWIFSILLIIITLPFSLVLTIKVVQEYERAVIFRLGRLPQGGAKGPGIFFIIPCIESYTKVDLRTVSFDVPPQEVLTKDSVTVSVDAVVYYRVSNPTVSVANVENAHHSTRLLAQTTLRNILGTKNMSEILSDRESISHGMQSTLDEATDRWGIRVERVEIKDVRLPVQLQRAMAAEAEAAREARAKVIAAEGEQRASRSLKEAADVMAQSSAALQLRYLQTLNTISAEKNSTIIFPLPIDMIQGFMQNRGR